MTLQIQTTYRYKGANLERGSGKSTAIPDQSLSVKQLIDRYAKGLPLGGAKMPVYDGDEDFYPDPQSMDISERIIFLEERQAELDKLQKDIKARRQKNLEAKADQERKATLDAIAKREEKLAALQERSTKGAKPTYPPKPIDE